MPSLLDNLGASFPFNSGLGDQAGDNDFDGGTFADGGTPKLGSGCAAGNSRTITDSDKKALFALGENDRSFAGWFRPSAASGSLGIFGKGSGAGSREWRISQSGSGILFWPSTDGGATYDGGELVSLPNTLAAGVWTFIGFTYDASASQGTLYAGKETDGSLSSSARVFSQQIADVGATFYHGDTGELNTFSGESDEFHAWGRVLSSADMGELFAAGDGLAYPFSGARLRTHEVALALVDYLSGNVYSGVTLEGNSEPALKQYVESAIVDVVTDGSGEIFDPKVSIVPRGKSRRRSHRSGFDEDHTVAVVVQRKLDPSSSDAINREISLATAAMLESIDDAVAAASRDGTTFGDNVQAVYDSSEINPFWVTDDLKTRQISTHVLEITFVAEKDLDE